jgi:hypothetical protein
LRTPPRSRSTVRRWPSSPTATATAGWYGAQSDNLSHIRGTTVRGGHDAVILSLRVSVPAEANCLTLAASFFSEDYGESVTDDPRYFDTFLAELDPAAPWSAGDGDPSTLDAPANFALVRMPDGLKRRRAASPPSSAPGARA